MVKRESVVKLTEERYKTALILEQLLLDDIKTRVDINRLLDDPKGYLAEFFVLEGSAYYEALADRAIMSGKAFAGDVSGKG